jgi:hypothetical protein
MTRAAPKLGCIKSGDNEDSENNWWISYKSTGETDFFWGDDLNLASGLKYDQNDFTTSPVYHTLRQIYPLGKAEGVNYAIYNDQWKMPGKKSSVIAVKPYVTSSVNCGHMKGVIAYNTDSQGFWITHSYVSLPSVICSFFATKIGFTDCFYSC